MKNFNWALFIGCCLIALAILSAGMRIASHIPHNLTSHIHGFSGHVSSTNNDHPDFMNNWQAAMYLSLDFDEFQSLVNSGELSGTYASFEVERRIWVRPADDTLWEVDNDAMTAARPVLVPVPTEYEIVNDIHRVFSRERLAEWLNNKII